MDLQKYEAKLCLTAGGLLIHEDRVLLVKHKKLGIWLPPGGHIEADELPHRTVEREFWEETGVKVQAYSINKSVGYVESEALVLPFTMNLHWISRENYQARKASNTPKNRVSTKNWPLGCEQHLVMAYLVKPVKGVVYRQNVEETDGIAWFEAEELDDLETTEDIKSEIKLAFKLAGESK